MISIRKLKLCGKSTIKPLLIIYKKFLEKGCFPNEWKKAIVSLVHKKMTKSYRKLCCFYKTHKPQPPKYLYSIVPSYSMSYRIRQCNKTPAITHGIFKNTFFPSSIIEWNN